VTALRRHTENETRQHDALNQALEEMLAGLVLFDAEDRLVFCNRRYREFYGVPEELARPGTRFADMLLEEVRSGKLAMTAEEQEGFVTARLERRSADLSDVVEQRNADGRWLQIRERVMAGGWVVGVHVDATALKDKERVLEAHIQELHAMRAELEQRTAELSQLAANLAMARDEALGAARTKANFLANMSHELRTPLNAVIGFAEILASGTAGALTPQQTEYLADIRSSGNHLLGVINDILDISKAEAGKIELQEEEIDLADFVNSTVRLMLATARNKNLTLLTDVPADLTRLLVLVDARRFRQVILNLLSNAIKFTPEQGSVHVAIAVPAEQGVSITISDTGVGIAAQDLGKVFAPFEQADSSLARRYEGTGLGLALVKALIELHQGKVTLTSTPGLGTQVKVWLPPRRTRGQG
jgi:two-component system cell cycle sensor histidine kinase PleC